MQRLRVPFKQSTMVCGYKTDKYKQAWGYPHYGIDISSYQGNMTDDHTIYASGEGVVVSAGWDSKLGGALCIKYPDAINHQTNKPHTVIARYMHMDKVLVKQEDKVTLDTPIGIEGKQGTKSYHLHMELDTDTQYPTWTPQVSRGLSYWVHGLDSTVNPSYYLHQDSNHKTLPDNWADGWLNEVDRNLPFADNNPSIHWNELRALLEARGIESIII